MTTPQLQRLEAWMKEVTDLLCYQPEIPLAHKTILVDAMKAFERETEPDHEGTTIKQTPKC